jgi:hypothetical protein
MSIASSPVDSNGIAICSRFERSHEDRMLAEINRIVSELRKYDPTGSYPDQLEKAEEIYERQESRRIKLEAQRTAAAISAIPTPPVSHTFKASAIGSCMHSIINQFINQLIVTYACHRFSSIVLCERVGNVVSNSTTINMSAPPTSETTAAEYKLHHCHCHSYNYHYHFDRIPRSPYLDQNCFL